MGSNPPVIAMGSNPPVIATGSRPSFGINPSLLTKTDQPRDPEDVLDEDVFRWIETSNRIPKDLKYDWFPFCKALIQNHRDVSNIFQPPPPPGTPDYILKKNVDKLIQFYHNEQGDVVFEEVPDDEVPNTDPVVGSWDHVIYCPEWTDPDYNENFMKTPAGGWRQNSVRDAMFNLRPALRLEDAIRNPTDYAQRFGIAQGRIDGRSRMSPTWSKTRDPMDDFASQVDRMTDAEKEMAIKKSRERLAERRELPVAGQEILPEVMEEMLEANGVLTNAQLKAYIEDAAKRGMSLDEMIERLEKTNPQVGQAHRVFLQNALDDQDYQRVLLAGLTTDEMIHSRQYAQSDDVLIDLDNEIHPLFQRSQWVSSEWKGSSPYTPKLAYNLAGKREPWDMTTNDALWQALQPALRLVSMVLSKNPPLLEALFDMRTRQPLDSWSDTRQTRGTPTLTKYVRHENIDLGKTYPEIYELHARHNYNWKENVLRRLGDIMRLELKSGWNMSGWLTVEDENNADQPYTKFMHGCAVLSHTNNSIHIWLAVEKIWPLLVPQYSKVEKMLCSFDIANTLLHEFAHTVNHAQYQLCALEEAQPPGQNPEITGLLYRLGPSIWNRTASPTDPSATLAEWEPYFEDYPECEAGRHFEDDLWGGVGFPIEFTNRHYATIPIFFFWTSYPCPFIQMPLRAVQRFPLFYYHFTRSIDHVRRFFTKEFWEGDFAAYGFPALKMKPDSDDPQGAPAAPKFMWEKPIHFHDEVVMPVYGPGVASFMRTVIALLHTSRHGVLAQYLQELWMESVYSAQYDRWWAFETSTWSVEEMHPLHAMIDRSYQLLARAAELHRRLYRDNNPPEFYESVDMSGEWTELFRRGGRIMQSLALVDAEMQDHIGYLQRLVFYYPFSKSYGDNRDWGQTPALRDLYRRADIFRQHAERLAQNVDSVSYIPELADDRENWQKWGVRFLRSQASFIELTTAILQMTNGNEPFNATAKARFDRILTAEWKMPSERYEKMAAREYVAADPAVQKTVDEFMDYLRLGRMRRAAQPTIEQLRDSVGEIGGIGGGPSGASGAMFDFNIPPTAASSGFVSSRAPIYTQPVTTPAPSSAIPPSSNAIFGVPGVLRNPLTGLVRRVPRSAEGLGYQDYASNLLSSPDLAQAADDIFASGGDPQSLLLSPGRKQLVRGSGPSQFSLFPSPFTSRAVMTSEAAEFDEMMRRKNQEARAAGTYTTTPTWREKRPHDGDDDSLPPSPERRARYA
ncbi:hypothetical protein F5Y03DRAFT_399624 [Xylaria venustula]|nr:hypothetical protein F5Y03DRAFT_399624 [Xylaria venustula]